LIQAETDFREGRIAESDAALESLASLRRPTARDLLLLAEVRRSQGRPDEAIAALDQVPDLDPLAPQAQLLLGRIERRRGRARKAEASFLRALKGDPNLLAARRELINIYGLQLRRREIHEQFLAVSDKAGLNFQDLVIWMHIHALNWDEAEVAELESFLRADPDDRFTRLALAEVALTRSESMGKIAGWLAPLPPDDRDAQALRAGLALETGHLDEATSILASGPEDHPGLERMRGRLAMIRKDYPVAAEHLRKALAAGADERGVAYLLGQCLKLSGNPSAAAGPLDRYARLTAAHDLIRPVVESKTKGSLAEMAKIARACEDAGLNDEARAWYDLIIRTDPLDRAGQAGVARMKRSKRPPP
jgi:tetratricopeptide (TPR) repeat protein